MIDHDVHLTAIVGGDAHAFGRWMAAVEPTVRLTLKSFATVVDVEAVLQEALLRVWQVAPRFERDGEPNGLLRFAIRIARNLAISEVRRMKARAPDEPEPAVEATPPDPLLRAVIGTCHDKLPPRPREALDARLAASGKPDDAIAEALGMKLNTFLQNITRAKSLLADCLKTNGVELSWTTTS